MRIWAFYTGKILKKWFGQQAVKTRTTSGYLPTTGMTEESNFFMNINYIVKRSRKRKRTISLQISDNSELVIAAPYFTPLGEINRFVQEKQNWIHKTIQKHKEEAIKTNAKEYITGEMFYYLGELFPLETFFEKN